MKKNIAKWLIQFLFSALLVSVTWQCGRKFFIHGEVTEFRICMMAAAAIGVVFGDISLYQGKKVMGWSVVMLSSLTIIGSFLVGWWSMALQFYLGVAFDEMPWFVGPPIMFAPTIIIAIIGYNIFDARERRLANKL